MIPLVLWLGLAAQAPVSPQLDSVASERCRSVLARKLGLNIGPVTVAERRRLRDSTLLEGSFSGYRPPTPPSPGMAAPGFDPPRRELLWLSPAHTAIAWNGSAAARHRRPLRLSVLAAARLGEPRLDS